nr:EOG090X0DBE [Artemia franciscana]
MTKRDSQCKNFLSTSSSLFGFLEFFDDPKNFGAQEVKVGRSWKVDELRLKSNVDLHKLWYILLKERNMLLTMEHAHKEEAQYFPNPERMDKVEESMENLEKVVRERNRAYWQLETGKSGEQEGEQILNELGVEDFHKYTEHAVPQEMNKTFRKPGPYPEDEKAIIIFRRKLLEKRRKEIPTNGRYPSDFPQYSSSFHEEVLRNRRKYMKAQYRQVRRILEYFPEADLEAIARDYPKVDLKKVMLHHTEDTLRI